VNELLASVIRDSDPVVHQIFGEDFVTLGQWLNYFADHFPENSISDICF
jgi:hypothetical protein